MVQEKKDCSGQVVLNNEPFALAQVWIEEMSGQKVVGDEGGDVEFEEEEDVAMRPSRLGLGAVLTQVEGRHRGVSSSIDKRLSSLAMKRQHPEEKDEENLPGPLSKKRPSGGRANHAERKPGLGKIWPGAPETKIENGNMDDGESRSQSFSKRDKSGNTSLLESKGVPKRWKN